VELRRKGFGQEDIAAALGEISDEEESRTAREFAERRWEATKGMSNEARFRRITGALGRRGYPPGMALALVADLKRADIWDNPQGEAARFEEE
jgi:regulatory protein